MCPGKRESRSLRGTACGGLVFNRKAAVGETVSEDNPGQGQSSALELKSWPRSPALPPVETWGGVSQQPLPTNKKLDLTSEAWGSPSPYLPVSPSPGTLTNSVHCQSPARPFPVPSLLGEPPSLLPSGSFPPHQAWVELTPPEAPEVSM